MSAIKNRRGGVEVRKARSLGRPGRLRLPPWLTSSRTGAGVWPTPAQPQSVGHKTVITTLPVAERSGLSSGHAGWRRVPGCSTRTAQGLSLARLGSAVAGADAIEDGAES